MLFFLAFCIHMFRIVRFRSWYFIPFALACLMEVVGYAFRSLSAKKNPYNVIYFVVQYFFIVTAPVFISASIYVCLSRLIDWARSLGFAGRKWLRPKLILWIFIGADVVATVLQILGAALIGVSQSDKDYEKADKANTILLGGLAFQTGAFFIFLILLTAFAITLIRDHQFGSSLGGKRGFFIGLFIGAFFGFVTCGFVVANDERRGNGMSIYSDQKCCALTEAEFRSLTAEENRREKAALDELYYGPFEDKDDEWDAEMEDIDD